MKRREFIQKTGITVTGSLVANFGFANRVDRKPEAVTRKLFIYGGQFNSKFISYAAKLTGKSFPKICLLPTATGDSPNYISFWLQTTQNLEIKPYVQRLFIATASQPEPFDNLLLKMDAIIVGGGNTLNMLAVWKAQGVDLILRKAYEQGIVIAGGSAGSLCWFQNGMTDSRPSKLTLIEGLGWIPGSHCPHYDTEIDRKPLYHEMIKKKVIYPGYACDDLSGIYFENEKYVKAVTTNSKSKSFYVDLVGDEIIEKELSADLLQ